MTRTHEKLLVATLAGLILVGAAALAIQPALAGKSGFMSTPQLSGPSYDVLTLQLSARA